MRTEQLTITFPKQDAKYKKELLKMREIDNVNLSRFVVSCIKSEIGNI
jgi:hypothetical protein